MAGNVKYMIAIELLLLIKNKPLNQIFLPLRYPYPKY